MTLLISLGAAVHVRARLEIVADTLRPPMQKPAPVAGFGVDTIAIILFYFKRFFEKSSKIHIPVRDRCGTRRPENLLQNSGKRADHRRNPPDTHD